MQIAVKQQATGHSPVEVVFATADKKLWGAATELNLKTGGACARALQAPRFTGKRGQILDILSPQGLKARRLLIVGLGSEKELTPSGMRDLGGEMAGHLMKVGELKVRLFASVPSRSTIDEVEFVAHLVLGANLRSYRFAKYLTQAKKEPEELPLEALTIVCSKPAAAEKALAAMDALTEGVHFARDVVNEPPVSLYPDSFAKRIAALKRLGIEVQVLDEKTLQKIGAGGILAVGMGSKNPPRLVTLRWNGASKGSKLGPIALVGKGVCFDSGGLCLKKPSYMEEMKGDMAGAAAVVGAIIAAARKKARVDVVGVVALVENMPSDRSYKPGDIVKTLAGKTIEIFDTDAEGRMILVDALHYAASRFKPRCIVDVATLTGSILAALGPAYAGVFANDEKLASQLILAGTSVGERLWRMPLHDDYVDNLKSNIADLRHHGTDDQHADAAHAAALLHQFVDGCAWAHIDIAGKEFVKKPRSIASTGASGYGVALLDAFLQSAAE